MLVLPFPSLNDAPPQKRSSSSSQCRRAHCLILRLTAVNSAVTLILALMHVVYACMCNNVYENEPSHAYLEPDTSALVACIHRSQARCCFRGL